MKLRNVGRACGFLMIVTVRSEHVHYCCLLIGLFEDNFSRSANYMSGTHNCIAQIFEFLVMAGKLVLYTSFTKRS